LHYSPWQFAIAFLGITGNMLIAGIVVTSRRTKQWPSILFLCLFEAILSCLLLYERGVYRHYFWTYWIAACIRPFLRLWIVADIARSFPGLGWIPRKVWIFLGSIGVSILVLSFVVNHHAGIDLRGWVSGIVLRERAVEYALLMLYAFFLLVGRVTGFAWSASGSLVAHGTSIQALTSAIAPLLFAFTPNGPKHTLAEILIATGGTASLCVWGSALRSRYNLPANFPSFAREGAIK